MALERVCTHETLSDKSSYASKLLSSFITDCGKALLKGCVKASTYDLFLGLFESLLLISILSSFHLSVLDFVMALML